MKAFVVLGRIAHIGFLMVISSFFNGYALSVLWGWFVVPTFGAPPLHIVPAIGVTLMVNHLKTYNYGKEQKSFSELIKEGTAVAILKSSVALFFGWTVHLFM